MVQTEVTGWQLDVKQHESDLLQRQRMDFHPETEENIKINTCFHTNGIIMNDSLWSKSDQV